MQKATVLELGLVPPSWVVRGCSQLLFSPTLRTPSTGLGVEITVAQPSYASTTTHFIFMCTACGISQVRCEQVTSHFQTPPSCAPLTTGSIAAPTLPNTLCFLHFFYPDEGGLGRFGWEALG